MQQIKSSNSETLELSVTGSPLGRKRKLTPKLFEKIMLVIESGERINPACRSKGISERTLFSWIQKDPACAQRFNEAKAARLRSWHDRWLGEMCAHSEHSPWATGWLLERNFPALYAMKPVERPELPAASGQGATQLMILTVSDADFAQLENEPGYAPIPEGGLESNEHGMKIQVYRMDANARLLN